MANPTNDASNGDDKSTSTDLSEAFGDLKTQFEAEEKADKTPAGSEEEEDDDTNNDAEADDANDSDDADGAADDDQEEDDSDSDDDSDDDKDDAKGKQASEFRLSQFKGEKGTSEEYIKNLEDGYLNSSQEALRIKDERDGFERQVSAIKAAAGKDPEFGEKLLGLLKDSGGASGDDSQGDGGFGDDKATQSSNNPFLVNAETEWNQKNEASIKEFVDANPEVLTDPKINAEVKRWARVYTREVYDSEKRLMTTGEAMQMAYKQLGYDDKRNSQQDLVNGMKKNAAPTRPQGAKKKSGGSKSSGNTKQFSDLTLTLAEKMGMSKERLVKGTKR